MRQNHITEDGNSNYHGTMEDSHIRDLKDETKEVKPKQEHFQLEMKSKELETRELRKQLGKLSNGASVVKRPKPCMTI